MKSKRKFPHITIALAATALLGGCLQGVGDLGSARDATLDRPRGNGFLRAPMVTGLHVESRDAIGDSDETGRFVYELGQPVEFSIGGVTIGALTAGRGLVTPLDIARNGTINNQTVLNITRFLMMLDRNGDPFDGVEISEAVREIAATWQDVDFTRGDLEAQVVGIVSDAASVDGTPHELPDAEAARALLDEAMTCLYAGGFQGALAQGDNGRYALYVDPNSRTLSGFVLSSLPVTPQLRSLTGTSQLDFTQAQISLLATDQAAVQYTIQYTDLNRLTGSWTSPQTVGQPGTLAGGRITPATFTARYRFQGKYDGDDSGVFVLDIPREGNTVLGRMYSVTSDFALTLNGRLENERFLVILGEDGSTNFNGEIDWDDRTVSGDWFNEFSNEGAGVSGEFSGSGCPLI
jgi:hypothetical protein